MEKGEEVRHLRRLEPFFLSSRWEVGRGEMPRLDRDEEGSRNRESEAGSRVQGLFEDCRCLNGNQSKIRSEV